jgi:cytochrome c oxidase cbb3-type subunit III
VIQIRLRAEWLPRPMTPPSQLVIVFLMLVAGCDLPGQPKLADKPISADKVADFDLLYQQNCIGCHGADGQLGPAPPLNDGIFLAIIPDTALLHVIAGGRTGTPMSAFAKDRGGPLTDAQVKVLVAGIRPRWSSPHKLDDAAPPYAAPPYAAAAGGGNGNIEQGASVFARACAPCHGPIGEGGETSEGGAGAINDPAFLALISDQALRRYVITGRPDLGMPSYADKTGRSEDYQPITSGQIGDLVAFLASWRQSD